MDIVQSLTSHIRINQDCTVINMNWLHLCGINVGGLMQKIYKLVFFYLFFLEMMDFILVPDKFSFDFDVICSSLKHIKKKTFITR